MFTPRDEDSITDMLRQQQIEQERVRAQHAFLTWARERLATPDAPLAPPAGVDRYLDPIKGFALNGDLYERKIQAQKLIDEIGFRGKGHPWEVAFQLLVALGIWEQDEELSILRYHIPTHFPAEVLEAAAATSDFTPPYSGYQDLTSLLTFTIDDADTMEIDDALSVSSHNGVMRIGVHITDVGFFIPPDNPLDKAALTRGTTGYLPRGKLPMLPPLLSEDKASLIAGQVRPTLSFSLPVVTLEKWPRNRFNAGYQRRQATLIHRADALLSARDNKITSALRYLFGSLSAGKHHALPAARRY